MIDLYAMGSPNVVKIYIALEELALPYTVKKVDVFGGEQFDARFTAISPLAKVPVITDHEGPGGQPYTVFESGAILTYLAEKTGKLLPASGVARYDALQWLMVQMTGVGPMFGQYVHFLRFAPAGNDYAKSRYATQVLRYCDALNRRLEGTAYLGGADYTIADIATFPWINALGYLMPGAKEKYPAMMAWAAKVNERPAVVKALAAVADIRSATTAFDKAAPETLDRVFGRGSYAEA